MTESEAIELAKSGWWQTATPQEIVAFQLFEERLCMHFGDFHKAIEQVLHRPVWTHEFALVEELRKEYLTQRSPMSLNESIGRLQEKYPHLKLVSLRL